MFRSLLHVIDRRKDDLAPAKVLPEPANLGFQPPQGSWRDPSRGGAQRDLGRRAFGVGGGQVELESYGWKMRDRKELGGAKRHGYGEDRGDGEADSGGEGRGEEEFRIYGGYCAEFPGALVGGAEKIIGCEQHFWRGGGEDEEEEGGCNMEG